MSGPGNGTPAFRICSFGERGSIPHFSRDPQPASCQSIRNTTSRNPHGAFQNRSVFKRENWGLNKNTGPYKVSIRTSMSVCGYPQEAQFGFCLNHARAPNKKKHKTHPCRERRACLLTVAPGLFCGLTGNERILVNFRFEPGPFSSRVSLIKVRNRILKR